MSPVKKSEFLLAHTCKLELGLTLVLGQGGAAVRHVAEGHQSALSGGVGATHLEKETELSLRKVLERRREGKVLGKEEKLDQTDHQSY